MVSNTENHNDWWGDSQLKGIDFRIIWIWNWNDVVHAHKDTKSSLQSTRTNNHAAVVVVVLVGYSVAAPKWLWFKINRHYSLLYNTFSGISISRHICATHTRRAYDAHTIPLTSDSRTDICSHTNSLVHSDNFACCQFGNIIKFNEAICMLHNTLAVVSFPSTARSYTKN